MEMQFEGEKEQIDTQAVPVKDSAMRPSEKSDHTISESKEEGETPPQFEEDHQQASNGYYTSSSNPVQEPKS